MAAAHLILALDTATSLTRVAVLRGADLVAEREAPPGAHSARLLPAIETVLAEAGLGLPEVTAFALAIGPGTFTGLRIGLATAKGLAFGTDRPVLGISSLQALAAAAAPTQGPALALLDARRGELYAGLYERPGDAAESDAGDAVATPEELAGRLPARFQVVAGEGTEEAAARLAEAHGVTLLAAAASAERVGRLAAARLAALAGRALPDPAALVPRYLRRAEAEVRRIGERFEKAPTDTGTAPGRVR